MMGAAGWLHFSHVFHGVTENLQAEAVVRQNSVFPLHIPLRMILRIKIGFRMGHQAENAARGIAQAGDCVQGTIGIVRKFLCRLAGYRIRIAAGDASQCLEAFQQILV